jgi:hypothetical protein
MKKFLCPGVLTTTLLFASSAWGQSLQLGVPTMSGTGCTAGTSSVALSSDQTILSVIFSEFNVESESGNDRANCAMVIPIKVPDGYRLKVFKIDYRGFVSLPNRTASAELITKNALVDHRIKRGQNNSSKTFLGPKEKEFSDTQALRDAWSSECGAQTEIQLETLLVLHNRGNRQRDMAQVTLDSLDTEGAGMQFQIKLHPCH